MDWRFSIFLLTMFGLLLGFSWAASDVGLCTIKVAQKAMKGDDATTCFEFWLNRYQTLVGALVALAAGVAAWRSAMLQIRLAGEQSKISARQTSIALVQMLNKELEQVRRVSELAVRANDFQRMLNFHRKKMISGLESMLNVADDNPAGLKYIYENSFQTYMQAYASALIAMRDVHSNLVSALAEAMLSGDTKKSIRDYSVIIQHSLYGHSVAEKIFADVIYIFDMPKPRHRVDFLNEKLSEITRQVIVPLFDSHPGYNIAVQAAKNIDALLDASLANVEGRVI